LKKVILFLAVFLLALSYVVTLDLRGLLPDWIQAHRLLFRCILSGGFGGFVYLARAVYLNACVRKNWDVDWEPWYYIRPTVSLVMGGVGFLFLKAGLLVLDSSNAGGSSNVGILALAFIAGLNVDRFIQRIEEASKSIWGIEESRTSKQGEKGKNKR
jgi:hypothetical protein